MYRNCNQITRSGAIQLTEHRDDTCDTFHFALKL